MCKAIILDVASILLFVSVGGNSHGQTTSVGSVLATAAPFLIALSCAWLGARAWKRPIAWQTALIVWPVTVILGQILRRTIFGRGTAMAFIIVSAVVLGLLLVGWRLVYKLLKVRFVPNVSGSTNLES